MNERIEAIRRVFRNAGLYHHASDDLLCGELADVTTVKQAIEVLHRHDGGNDLNKAIAALREVPSMIRCADHGEAYVRVLNIAHNRIEAAIAALDAARGQAVAWGVRDETGEIAGCVSGAEWAYPKGTPTYTVPLYAAPPAAAVSAGTERLLFLQKFLLDLGEVEYNIEKGCMCGCCWAFSLSGGGIDVEGETLEQAIDRAMLAANKENTND